jgi:hypothetical protein
MRIGDLITVSPKWGFCYPELVGKLGLVTNIIGGPRVLVQFMVGNHYRIISGHHLQIVADKN